MLVQANDAMEMPFQKAAIDRERLLFAGRHDAPNSSQTERCQTAFAWLAEKCRSVAVSQAKNLCSAMDASISVFVNSAQIGNNDAPELTMPHRCTSFVYDLDEDVSVRDMEITWVNGAGNCEHRKLGGTVEVADRPDTVRSRLADDLRAEGPA